MVVRSFEELTNKPVVFVGKNRTQGITFNLARGTADYFFDLEFESHNLSNSNLNFSIGFWAGSLSLYGDGLLYSDNGPIQFLGWKDDELHHLHVDVNLTNLSWTLQLDDGLPLSGNLANHGSDVLALYLSLSGTPDTNVMVGIDNIVIGTRDDFVPLRPVHSFQATDGDQPQGNLVRGTGKIFFGTTTSGGPRPFGGLNFGTVFAMNTDGKLIWSFPFHGTDGSEPSAGPTVAAGGLLFGTTTLGGKHGAGTIYQMTTGGRLIRSVSFSGDNGANPVAPVLCSEKSGLYGTTFSGGRNGQGVLFRMDARGNVQVLHSFLGEDDGSHPVGGLTLGDDGNLYGTTSSGGPHLKGTVFKMTPQGRFTTLFSFNGANGSSPQAGLTRGAPGVFYGTAAAGGDFENGTIFRITAAGAFTILHSFATPAEGQFPYSDLATGKDGNLYGTTLFGGPININNQYGTVFRINPRGQFQSLSAFHGGDGSFSKGGLVEMERGKFYGSALGGYFSGGKVFCLSAEQPLVAIDRPGHIAKRSGDEFEITGLARCDPPVTNVFYQVNDGGWTGATSTNSWLKWKGIAILASGKNIIRAYAVSALGDVSRTNSLKIDVSN